MHAGHPSADYIRRSSRRVERRQRRRRIARALLALGLELTSAYAIFSVVSVSPATAPAKAAPAGLTADDVVEAPARFRSEPVTVRGRIVDRSSRLPKDAKAAFVLGGPLGGRVLVLRSARTRGYAFTIGTTVEVRGDAVVPPESRRLLKRPASRTAIAKRMRTPVLIEAAQVKAVRRNGR